MPSGKLTTDDDILAWLNTRKKQSMNGQCPISDAIHGKQDDLSGGGVVFEFPVVSIFFFNAAGASVTSTVDDADKCAAQVHLKCGDVLLWVRAGHEALLPKIEHGHRLANVSVA